MKAVVVLLGTVEEQIEAGDDEPIDPHAVDQTKEHLPLFAGFDYAKRIGTVSNVRVENGRLVADIETEMFNIGISAQRVDNQRANLLGASFSFNPASRG